MIKRTHEALSRLGVQMVECPECGNDFNATRTPRYWINVWDEEGELESELGADTVKLPWGNEAGDEIVVHELCCSKECGDSYTRKLRELRPEGNLTGFSVWADVEGRFEV